MTEYLYPQMQIFKLVIDAYPQDGNYVCNWRPQVASWCATNKITMPALSWDDEEFRLVFDDEETALMFKMKWL
jgi:hypothetical protein